MYEMEHVFIRSNLDFIKVAAMHLILVYKNPNGIQSCLTLGQPWFRKENKFLIKSHTQYVTLILICYINAMSSKH